MRRSMPKTLVHAASATIFIVYALAVQVHAETGPRPSADRPQTAFEVVQAYLRAVHARDFDAAYEYISTADRAVRDKNTYLRGEQSAHGFALQLGRWFANEMQFWVIEERFNQNRGRIDVGYRLPSGDEAAEQLAEWNPEKLNALAPSEQSALRAALEKAKRSGKMVTIEGRDSFDLVREKHGWKIFADWRSRRRVRFEFSQPQTARLAVKFLRNDVLVKSDEPFQVDLTVTNESDRALWLKIDHSFLPRRIAKSIDMIACGSLAPFRLDARQTRQISSTYIFRETGSSKTPLSIIYDFAPAPSANAP